MRPAGRPNVRSWESKGNQRKGAHFLRAFSPVLGVIDVFGAVRGLGFSRMATYFGGMLRIEPCLPSPAERPPTGPEWVHEIKHDGYRLMARRDPVGIRLLTRNGHDWAPRYPLIVEAVNALQVRSCLIDGEAVVCDEDGRAVFERLRKVRRSRQVFLCAFDLLELDGKDLRGDPFEVRKATLASLLRARLPGLQFNQHLTHPGDIEFGQACKMGLEGIVSKRLGSRYVSGRSKD
jgi:bifunctional non-homologous end joining protein LigD